MRRIIFMVVIFSISLFLIACNQSNPDDELVLEEYDLTELENCINTFRDNDENTVCETTQIESLMQDYQTHFKQYFDFSIEITQWTLKYSDEGDHTLLRVDLLFKDITPEYQDDEHIELFMAVYESVLEDFNSMAVDEELYVSTWFAGPNNYDISHVFVTSTVLGEQQVRFGYRASGSELSLFEDKIASVEGYLSNDEFTSSSISIRGEANQIRVVIDLVNKTYRITVDSTVLGSPATITSQEVDTVISQYFSEYTLNEE